MLGVRGPLIRHSEIHIASLLLRFGEAIKDFLVDSQSALEVAGQRRSDGVQILAIERRQMALSRSGDQHLTLRRAVEVQIGPRLRQAGVSHYKSAISSSCVFQGPRRLEITSFPQGSNAGVIPALALGTRSIILAPLPPNRRAPHNCCQRRNGEHRNEPWIVPS